MKELIVGGFLTPQFLFGVESRLLHCEIEMQEVPLFDRYFIGTDCKQMHCCDIY